MPIKEGDTVKVHYVGTLNDGTVFDDSRDRDPLEITMGKGMLIPGFESAILGRDPGDTFSVTVSPEDAYGDRDPEMVFTVAKTQVPTHIPMEVGTPLQLSNEQGQMDVTITEIDEDEITLDANHPLAGKELTFKIEILSPEKGE
ncbi:MAG: peptidylprolyl isomerase [Desulfovibrio sp.]|jgi:peptidylprolyl isomerase|nr:peptidylprolyl isomerase [Desulfovibrio sp.]